MLLQQFIFYFFAASLIFSATMVIVSRNPVTSALYLVYGFFNSAILWMLLDAEFLSLVLIFVYVGAVMTLFLFVVMMMNIDVETLKKGLTKHYRLAIFAVAIVLTLMVMAIWGVNSAALPDIQAPANYSNTQALGDLLYTHYVYPFELSAMLLLVAIVSAIVLSQHKRGKSGRKTQNIRRQVDAQASERVHLVNMPSEKRE
ncbi:MAG: NADH-quinone oxidoreductase subunit J [Gammaproteobacteria bacterium]|nr:NADH-quinone oxidoreductase subunit J [Gammaproteobacteria bacterium]